METPGATMSACGEHSHSSDGGKSSDCSNDASHTGSSLSEVDEQAAICLGQAGTHPADRPVRFVVSSAAMFLFDNFLKKGMLQVCYFIQEVRFFSGLLYFLSSRMI